MKKLTLLLVVSVFFQINQTHAQTFTNYTAASTSNTLPGNDVTVIAIDAKGNKWFGVEHYEIGSSEVRKFDGSTWTTYNTADGLANNLVWAIVIDSQGNKWFGTSGGVSELSAEGSSVIKPVLNKNQLNLYPNPTQDIVHIDLIVKAGSLEVSDISGKSMLKKEIRENNMSIDVSGMDNGIYFVKVLSGDQMFTGKFVKN